MKFLQKMFVVIPPQKKSKPDSAKEAEMHERVPLKASPELADV